MKERAPLRVAHLIQNFAIGGLERMVQSLGRGARSHGVETWVIAYKGEVRDFRDALEIDGLHTAFIPTAEGLQPGFIARLARWLRQHHIDVLHSHNVGPSLYASVAAKLARVAHVYTEHSRERYDRTRRKWLGHLIDRLSTVVAISEEGANFRSTTFGRRCHIIENGVCVDSPSTDASRDRARALMGVDCDRFAVGCVARLSEEKNHSGLLRSFAALRARLPRASLVLIGDGAMRPAIENFVQRNGLEHDVHALGARKDVVDLLPGLDVVALASHREGLPLALLEAMAAGVPVIGTAVGGIPNLIAHGGGVVVPPGDDDAMTTALEAYGRDPRRTAQHGAQARAVVEARYSAAAMTEAYVALYREVDATRRRSTSRWATGAPSLP